MWITNLWSEQQQCLHGIHYFLQLIVLIWITYSISIMLYAYAWNVLCVITNKLQACIFMLNLCVHTVLIGLN